MTSVSRSNIISLNPHRHTFSDRLMHAVQGRSVWERRIAHYECTTSTLACLARIQKALFMIWHIIAHSSTLTQRHPAASVDFMRSSVWVHFTNISWRLQSRRGLQMVADKRIVLEISKIIILKTIPLIAHEFDAVIEPMKFTIWLRYTFRS